MNGALCFLLRQMESGGEALLRRAGKKGEGRSPGHPCLRACLPASALVALVVLAVQPFSPLSPLAPVSRRGDRPAGRIEPPHPLIVNGPPLLPQSIEPPRTVVESFSLELAAAPASYDTGACASGLAEAFGIPAADVSVEADGADGAGTVRIAVRVQHRRASRFSALSALDALPRAQLEVAVGGVVLAGLPFCLSVLHVNDQHSRVEPVNAALNTWGSREDVATNATKYGGAALVWGALAARRSALASAGKHVVVVNAGDEFQGSPYFSYYGGNLTAQLLLAAGLLDLMAVGNHEFDLGPSKLAAFLGHLGGQLPVRAHNIDVRDEPALSAADFSASFYPRGYEVLTFAREGAPGVRVALVGLTTASTPQASSPGPRVRFREPLAALSALIPRLRAEEGVQHVLVVSHLGVEADVRLAAQVPGVSAVVGGHSHTLIWHAHNVSRHDGSGVVPVVQARAYSRYVGELQLCWPQHLPRSAAGAEPDPTDEPASAVATLEVIDLPAGSFPPHAKVAALVAAAAPAIDVYKRTVVGVASTDLTNRGCYTHDCAAGRLVARALRSSAFARAHGAAIGLQNAGGTRSSFTAGNVTLAQVMTVAPFQDAIAVCKLSGRELLLALEHGLGAVRTRPPGGEGLVSEGLFAHAFPQLSGLRLCYDPARAAGSRVLRAELAGTAAELRPDELYGLATPAFVLRGGDGFASLRAACSGGASVAGGPLDSEAIAELFRSSSPLGASDFPPAIELYRAQGARWGWLLGGREPEGVCSRAAAAGAASALPHSVRFGVAALPMLRADQPPESVMRAALSEPGGAHPCSHAPTEGAVAWKVCSLDAGGGARAPPSNSDTPARVSS